MERGARWALAVLLLAWVAAPAWPEVLDEVYLSAADAHRWVEEGRLQGIAGEDGRVPSPLGMVAAMAVMVRLGLDVGLWAQVLAMACGAGLLGLLSALLPRGGGGTLALLAVAGWAPLAWWSAQGIETTLYALLLGLAWAGALRGGEAAGWGVLAASLASLARPEGAAHLVAVLALGLRAWGGPWTPPAPAVAGVLGLLGVHVLRVQHAGAPGPASPGVDVASAPWGPHGLAQLGGDLVSLAGPLAAVGAALAWRPGRRTLLALAPLAIQALVLVHASGDGMTRARLTLPGALASLVALVVLLPPARTTPLRMGVAGIGLVAGMVLAPVGFGRVDLDLRRPPSWAEVRQAWTRGLSSPVADDVTFAAWNLAEGARLATADPGLLAHLPGVALAGEGARGVDWWRVGEPSDPTAPARAHTTAVATIEHPRGRSTWRAATAARGDAALAATRLAALHERFPSHPHLAREAAIALAAAGRVDDATALARRAGRRWPHETLLVAAPDSLVFVGGDAPRTWVDGRGYGIFWNAGLWSRPLSPADLAAGVVYLDQDAAGAEPARARLLLLGACEAAVEVEVAGPMTWRLADLACEGAEGRSELRVSFLNDATEAGADRNLYVRVTLPPPGSAGR